MWFKKKIKEQPKGRLYGNRYNTGKSDFSVWDSMSFIEQICMIFLPIMLGFIFYMILDIVGLIWWLRIVIAAGMVIGCIGLITLIVNLIQGDY
jgi:hypothetical protein